MSQIEKAYSLIDELDSGEDIDSIRLLGILTFPHLDWEGQGERSVRQFLLDEVVNKDQDIEC